MSSLGYALFNETDNEELVSGSDSNKSSLEQKRLNAANRNKTIKKKTTNPLAAPAPANVNVKRMLDTIHGGVEEGKENPPDFYFGSGDLENGDLEFEGMANFNPPPKAELSKIKGQPLPMLEESSTHMPINADIPSGYESTSNGVTTLSGGANMPTPYVYGADSGKGASTQRAPPRLENFSNTLPNTYGTDNEFRQFVPYYSQMSQPSTGNRDDLLEKLNYMIHLLEEQQEDKTGHVLEEIVLYSFLGIFIIFIVDSFARAGKYIR
jgi:hypothetical protein